MNNIENNDSGKIYIKGTASEQYTCDRVRLEIKFYCSGLSGAKASESVMAQCERFLEHLSNTGMDIKQIQLENDRISQASYRDDEKVTASRTLKFDTVATAEMNNFILKLIQKEHLDAEVSTSYYLSNENELRKQLRVRAITDSKENADLLAAVAGKRVIGVDTIDIDAEGHTSIAERSRSLVSSGSIDDVFCIFSRDLSMPTKKLEEEATVTWLIE